MRMAIAADHGGWDLKQYLIERFQGLALLDLGAHRVIPDDDYPDYAVTLGRAVSSGEVQRGILLCGSGVGAAIAANKVKGVRACVCHDTYSARQAVEHDDLNVLVLGARVIGPELASELVSAFLQARFSNEARHRRRLDKVLRLED